MPPAGACDRGAWALGNRLVWRPSRRGLGPAHDRAYTVGGNSSRVGLRLTGSSLERARPGELPPEGLVRGPVQVPATGAPVVFLADHPVTGGYPVVAVVDHGDVDRCAQLRPGQQLRFAARP